MKLSGAFVCAADLHLRPDKPLCRKETPEEWIETQFTKLGFMLKFARNHNAPVLLAGDIAHAPTGWPAWMFTRLIQLFRTSSVAMAIPGQHDLPYHQLDRLDRSNLGVLFTSVAVAPTDGTIVAGFPWGTPITAEPGTSIAMAHLMVLKDKNSAWFPGQAESAEMAEKLLKKFPQYELIVTGDNHQPFAVEYQGRWLVNPGSMTRQRVNETHEPGFYFWKDGQVEWIRLPHDKDALRDMGPLPNAPGWAGDLQAVDAMLRDAAGGEVLDFKTALREYFKKRRTRGDVQRKILGED